MRHVGVPANRAGGAARSIEEHRFDGVWWTPSEHVGTDRFDIQVEPFEIGEEPLEAAARAIDGSYPTTGGRQLCGLATGCGAQIDDLASGKVAEQPRRERGCRVLNPPSALGITGQGGEGTARGPA